METTSNMPKAKKLRVNQPTDPAEKALEKKKFSDALPAELRVMVYEHLYPGPKLVWWTQFNRYSFHNERFEPPATDPYPVTLHMNEESREETLKKFSLVTTDTGDKGKSAGYMNFDIDTLVIRPLIYGYRFEEPNPFKVKLPAKHEKIKHLMMIIRYNRNDLVSDTYHLNETVWNAIRDAFPNLEDMIIWTTTGHIYTSVSELLRSWELDARNGGASKFIDQKTNSKVPNFAWWNSNPEWHEKHFMEIESQPEGYYRQIQDVTKQRFDAFKQSFPEWPLKEIRFLGGLETTPLY